MELWGLSGPSGNSALKSNLCGLTCVNSTQRTATLSLFPKAQVANALREQGKANRFICVLSFLRHHPPVKLPSTFRGFCPGFV